MSRAAFQVLVIPYQVDANGQPRYLLFKRADQNVWQWISGGGENQELPEQTARREAREEADIPEDARLIRLDSVASIPATHFADRQLWGTDIYVIPEYSFGVEVENEEVCLSDEHKECAWLDYETARHRLEWTATKPLCGSCTVVYCRDTPNKSMDADGAATTFLSRFLVNSRRVFGFALSYLNCRTVFCNFDTLVG